MNKTTVKSLLIVMGGVAAIGGLLGLMRGNRVADTIIAGFGGRN
jgi:hypothetical protein